MKHINIQDSKMPALGFGIYTLKGKDCVEGVRYAISIGYHYVDTEQRYVIDINHFDH